MDNPGAWPPVNYESRDWDLGAAAYGQSKTTLRRHRGPYLAAVPATIADRPLELANDVRMAAQEASQELTRFDAEIYANGELAPLTAVLLRTESASSSQIENLTSGARQIATASLGAPAAKNAELIAANARAMQAANRLADSLDETAIIKMQQELLGAEAIAGWRTEQVWIGGSGAGPHQAVFVPPHHDHVPPAMADLVRFMARDDLEVMSQTAVAHAQFETIHPFPDGNGRTGRALLHALLRAKGLARHVTVPVSAGLVLDVNRYFTALGAYRSGDPEAMIYVLSDAVFSATANARILVTDLKNLLDDWRDRLDARRDSVAWQLLIGLTNQPVVDAGYVQERYSVSGVAAQRALSQLQAAGIIREFTGKRRSRLWVADEVVSLLDEFAGRAGRRTIPNVAPPVTMPE